MRCKTRKQALLEFERGLRDKMKFLEWAPVITISALTGQRVERIPLVMRADEARNRRIPRRN